MTEMLLLVKLFVMINCVSFSLDF